MSLIRYKNLDMRGSSLEVVDQANGIIAEYLSKGFRLTLRQLYYQFVSRDLLANTVKNYKRLGNIVNDGRLAGLIDWDAIEDRTRSLSAMLTFSDPTQRIRHAARAYRRDLWAKQPYRIEVWVEKEALAGVVEVSAESHRVPFLSCRGYTSQSEMWNAGMRLKHYVRAGGQRVVVLHLGDHDPSGIDMSRDIEERLEMFMGNSFSALTFHRIALNMDQVEQYDPPPNPAKTTDSRYASYRNRFGDESWELDALSPEIIDGLITQHVDMYRDAAQWGIDIKMEERERDEISAAGDRWDEVSEFLRSHQ